MLTNNHKEKKVSNEGVIYTLILVTYFSIIILVFIFSVRFIGNTINSTLSIPQELQNNTENKIDLKSYSLIETKLNLNQIVPATTTPTSTDNILIATTTTTTTVVATTMTVAKIEVMPKIVVSNSTLKSGLARILKNNLQAAGLTVLKTNTIKPTTPQTIIKIKDSFNTT